jgi:hypothetical protein
VTQGSPYRKPLRKLRQGDIALTQFHQLRARSGEGRGPGPADVANEDLPFLGEPQDIPIELDVPGHPAPVVRILRVWTGYVIVLSQSCELEYADEQDSRVSVAPLVSPNSWPGAQWPLIERGSLPGYCQLPEASEEDLGGTGFAGPWPSTAVALGSATLVSDAMVRRNRILTLAPPLVVRLQEAMVRFSTVRGWADVNAAEALVGKTVIGIRETVESVPGPARLTKVFLDAPDGSGGDEITVICGLRSRRHAA